MANINKIPWEIGSILLCTKCGAKFNEPDMAEAIKSEIRKKQKSDETQGKIRVVTTSCLGVCFPEKQTVAFVPVEGKTEIYTVELNKQVSLQEVSALLAKKLSE